MDVRASRRTSTLVAAALAVLALPAVGAPRPAGPLRAVIVSGADAAAAVQAAGGRVTASLPLAHGVAADLPLRAELPAGLLVAEDRTLHATGLDAAGGSPDAAALRGTLGLSSPGTAGSADGTGVGVALVDTGVADVPALAGVLLGHIDATHGGGRLTSRGDDRFGHGTFLAGLVTQVAPGARLLDVRVADGDGDTRLSQVLRGLQAVADQGDALGVRVVSLALASPSLVPSALDPLALALEALWERGYTVVVPAGNDGPGAGSLASPGTDPVLLSVGGLDQVGTSAHADDAVAVWSGRGQSEEGATGPALVAPGAHLVGLRAPGSVIDVAHPGSRVGADGFLGSGTSMATAVTAGAAAVLLQAAPQLEPAGVAGVLTASAYAGPALADPAAAGSGGLDVGAALALAATGDVPAWMTPDPVRAGRWGDIARALRHHDLSPLARSWAARSWAARSWAARSWAARSWAARSWAARSWAARSWS